MMDSSFGGSAFAGAGGTAAALDDDTAGRQQHPHNTAAAEECGSALLDSVRSMGLADDVLLERLSSVATGSDLSASVAAAASSARLGVSSPRRRPAAATAAAAIGRAASLSSPPPPLPLQQPPPQQQQQQGPAKAPPPPPPPRRHPSSSSSSYYVPYKPTPLDRLRRRLVGPEVQLALQIAIGISVTAMFTFFDEARFPSACISATLFLVVAVQSSAMAHVGSRLGAAASFVGAMFVGAGTAGAVSSAARALSTIGSTPESAAARYNHAPEPGLTIAMSALSVPVLLTFASVRMAPAPPALQGVGLSLTLFYGLPLINSRAAESYDGIWRVVLALYLSGVVAVGADLFVSLLVLPSLASQAVEDAVARALRIAGQSLSRTSARAFSPPEASAVAVEAAMERKRSREASKRGGRAFFEGQQKEQGQGQQRQQQQQQGGQEAEARAGPASHPATAAAAGVWFDDDSSIINGSGGDESSSSSGISDDAEHDRSSVDRTRQSPDAWVVEPPPSSSGSGVGGGLRARRRHRRPPPAHEPPPPTAPPQQPQPQQPQPQPPLPPRPPSFGLPPLPPEGVQRSARSASRVPAFLQAARALPPVPVPGSRGAIAMEREPDEVPGFHQWWDLVSAPVEEPASARRQRRRRERALRARREHQRRVAEQAEARALARRQEREQLWPALSDDAPAAAANKSPFADAAAAAADDLEHQRQEHDREQQQEQAQRERRRQDAWDRLAYEEAMRPPAPGRAGGVGRAASASLPPSAALMPHLDLGAAGPPIAGLRPLLGAARMCLGAAALEPDFLRGRALRRFDPRRWAALIGAIEALVTRISALEAIAEDGGGLNEERAVWLAPMLAAKRGAFAEAAACLAILSEAAADSRLKGPPPPTRRGGGGGGGGGTEGACSAASPCPDGPKAAPTTARGAICGAEELFGRSWAKCRDDLRAGLMMQVEAYVRAVREAVAAAPAASSPAAAAPADASKAGDGGGGAGGDQHQSQQQPRLVIYSGYNARIHFFAFVVTAAVLDAMQRVDDAARAALCPLRLQAEADAELRAAVASKGGGRVGRLRVLLTPPPWLSSLAGMLLMRPAAAHLAALLPLVRAYFRALWRPLWRGGGGGGGQQRPPPPPLPREAVAALKYALACWIALTVTLTALATSALARQLNPVYGYVAVGIATTERVEATASRVVSWLLGTTAGGAVGLAIMASSALAGEAAALAALLGACAFCVSLLGLTAFRTTIVLSVMTISALVLCQYTDNCRLLPPPPPEGAPPCVPHGTVAFFAARISTVAGGVLLSQAVTSLVAPWFTSDWALVTMAGALRDAAAPFLEAEYRRFYSEGRAAYEAAASAGGLAVARTASEAAEAMACAATEAARQAVADGEGGVSGGSGGKNGGDKNGSNDGGGDNGGGGGDTSDPAAQAAAASRMLHAGLAAPLVAVQLSLARDAVQWERGVLATPPVVPAVLRSMLSLLDRLAALEITLQVGAPITGRFTGVVFRHYFLPMERAWRGVVVAAHDLARATAHHLVTAADHPLPGGGGGPCGLCGAGDPSGCAARRASRDGVLRAVAALQRARNRARDAQIASRMAHVRAMVQAPSDRAAFAEFIAPDDTLRFLSFVTAWIKALNRLESVARAALRDGDFCAGVGGGADDGRPSWLPSWLR